MITRQPPTNTLVYLFGRYFLYSASPEWRATQKSMLTSAHSIASAEIFTEFKIVKSGMFSIAKNSFVTLKYDAIPWAIRELITHGASAI